MKYHYTSSPHTPQLEDIIPQVLLSKDQCDLNELKSLLKALFGGKNLHNIKQAIRVSQMPKLLKFSPARSFSEPFYPKNSENAKKIQKSYV